MKNKKGSVNTVKKTAPISIITGVLVAILLGLFSSQVGVLSQNNLVWVLLGFGLLLGLININSQNFLHNSISLIIMFGVGSFALSSFNISMLSNLFNSLVILFVPAGFVVLLKSVFQSASIFAFGG